MRLVVTLITAAAFALHLALGCCAHHAHSNEEATQLTERTATHCHDCPGHIGQSQDSRPSWPGKSHSDCPGERCSDGSCVFMVSGKTVVAKAVFAAVLPHYFAGPVALGSNSSPLTAAIDSGGLIALPLRPHLLNRVLLI